MIKAGTDLISFWETQKYYQVAKKAILATDDLGLRILKKYAKTANNILDIGCGEGSRLFRVAGKKFGVGVDVSPIAIKIAKKQYPKYKFIKTSAEGLPFEDWSFDLVYSAYVLEHVRKPEEVITEAMRVVKNRGVGVFIAPNYGSPNRSSPVYKGLRLKKLFLGFIHDFVSVKGLNWNKVKPFKNNDYVQDYDTTIEPYLGSMIKFVKSKNFRVVECSSAWQEEPSKVHIYQKLFRILGEKTIFPFRYWGPKLILVVQKNQ